MIDFIEYVVEELKSKRLSKTNAAALVRQFSTRQFSTRPSHAAGAALLHPLLHRNVSDLSEQRYASTFTGEEFFLADHQVKTATRDARRVLPAVAYLEMARAAIEQALGVAEGSMLELRNTVWAQPIVVEGRQEINIALLAGDGEQIDYEIYSQDGDADVVHCQGRAIIVPRAAPLAIDVEVLRQQMAHGRMEPNAIYAACARMGLIYGPAFRGISGIERGTGQVLAQLRLPDGTPGGGFVLHPSVMDSALQSAVALLLDEPEGTQPRLPFALDSLRVVSACGRDLLAWVRYAPGSRASDAVVKLDLDLCDERGTVCVEMRGLSSRALHEDLARSQSTGTVHAVPVWETSELSVVSAIEFAEHHVVLCELPRIDGDSLQALLPAACCRVLALQSPASIAERYAAHALACLESIRGILESRPQRRVLFQLVVADHEEQALFAGLSGLLRTAALENSQFTGQVVLVSPETTAEALAAQLRAERGALDARVRIADGIRHVLRWQELPAESDDALLPFREDGVYLITGGLGALGWIFAGELLARTRNARVIVTGRSRPSAETQARLETVASDTTRLHYRQVDLSDTAEVTQFVAGIANDHGPLRGILHSAGSIADHLIAGKSDAQFAEVLVPKVNGTVHLDDATRDIELDFFVLFSSIAGAMGNVGQADYAAANGFLDEFAAYRNRLVDRGQRRGRTRSINWPLWHDGGIRPDAAAAERLQRTTGMQAMQTATGLHAFHQSLALPQDQHLVVEGEVALIRRTLFERAAIEHSVPDSEAHAAVANIERDTLAEKTQDYLRRQFSALLKVPSQKINPYAALENYGIDSMVAMKLTNELEKSFGSLPKTLFFEYQTICDLAAHLIAQYPAQLHAILAPSSERVSVAAPAAPATVVAAPNVAPPKRASNRRFRRSNAVAPNAATDAEPIAIIGLSGRYPEAPDLETYWRNLSEGRDCIVEVPKERWDWRDYFTDDRSRSGHHFSKWGGFISGADEFDPLFFNISPVEAELIDPQERLFLQHAWMAIEDAGYTRAGLQIPSAEGDLPGQVGVYAGVMYSEYQLFGAEASLRGERMGIAGSTASIANRVSYALNLHGPSMTLDTMCSSSLTAIHIACQDLKQRRTTLAIAGGVNVSVHPNKYLVLSAGQFISGDGHCQSFGEGGDGYIPGEGVGVVVLKRLADARRDGDHIYGVIRGSALTHGGKTNGYTVPNPQAQSSAISRALAESRIDARHISYVEAHGTGTKLGDPIEIAALSKSFRPFTQDSGFCRIGSAKSNIGHCESAAGIAGLTKVLLQMQNRQIVPSLHSAQLNPHIDFETSPFVVNQSLCAWERPVIDGRTLPRIAGISSFGAGGSNAHMIVEEAEAPIRQPSASSEFVIVLSARTAEQLRQKAHDLLAFVRARANDLDLAAVAYTLHVGREAMAERLGFVAASADELIEALELFLRADGGEGLYRGQVRRSGDALSAFSTDADLQQTVDRWIAHRKLPKLLDLWAKGLEVDWSKLYGDSRPPRVSLPVYPFARERYWVHATPSARRDTAQPAALHPLLHRNTSDLNELRYSSTFTGDEFFLAGHQVRIGARPSHKVLPGVAYLEMARAAVERALPEAPEPGAIELQDVVWTRPIIADEARQISIALLANGDGQPIDYEIYSHDSSNAPDGEIVHGQGRVVLNRRPAPASLDLLQLDQEMTRGTLTSDAVYAACARMGLTYGAAFRGLTEIRRGEGQVLASLHLPDVVAATSAEYVLHPSLLDGALQACIGLLDEEVNVSGPARLPFALESLRILAPCAPEMRAWARYAAGSAGDREIVKLDIDLCDEGGTICVQLRGLSTRALGHAIGETAAAEAGCLLAVPVWEASEATSAHRELAGHHVVLCGLPQIDASALQYAIPGSRCLSVNADRQETIAQQYTAAALACFAEVQSILLSRPEGMVLVQLVIGDGEDSALLAGLSALLKTAALETPSFAGQTIRVPAATTLETLAAQLHREKDGSLDSLVRVGDNVREVLRWQELASDAPSSPALNDNGLYLITGGLGALGVLFAKELLARTRTAKIVLTGRSPMSAGIHTLVYGLSGPAGRVTYRQLDLADGGAVERFIAEIQNEQHPLRGILHSAGMIADRFLLQKNESEFRQVLEPKVTGAFHLDEATRDVPLDFFVLFSSLAGALGNAGQVDYAAANGFLDQFAHARNRRVAVGERHGRTRSINWPLWHDGGMHIDAASRDLLQQTTGMMPMQTATGIDAFHRSLALPGDQLLIVEGDVARMRAALAGDAAPRVRAAQQGIAEAIPSGPEPESLAEQTRTYLRKEFAEVLKLPAARIDPQAPLEDYGIDSILALRLTNQLEKSFGALSKTLLFEYQTISALAEYFVKVHPATVQEIVGRVPATQTRIAQREALQAPARRRKSRFVGTRTEERTEIAIVGLAGRYPQAETLDEFWRNLQNGRDCITEVPEERWDHSLYYDADPNKAGKSYSKWGGFLGGVDRFDPLLFNISPKEAALIDPQERLFLETAWQTIEDAGYTKESIAARRVGVYVGVMWGQYELFGAESVLRGNSSIPSSSHASIANRVSYFFDLHGPSIALDTMCSSSLTAIHLACEELRSGAIDAALAGGVNLTVHPYKYLSLSQGKFAASDGRCRSFGAGGDGYVPGEGVGAVLLKPLAQALHDGDQIYAIIKSSSVNHGGKTNGYTVPNPNAQGDLILDALKKADIDPRTLSYIETHGTGTSLGDPIEITGLLKAFGAQNGTGGRTQFCPIGSVKSNIGHLESAAGIAALTKALLQIKHKQLVPSLHAEPLNPHIEFERSPFYVQTTLADWTHDGSHPRRVGVSSFGAGGSNAHLILEEYPDVRARDVASEPGPQEAFVLSARDRDALRRYALAFAQFLGARSGASLHDIAYTLQTGRTPMDARLVILAVEADDLERKLRAWLVNENDDADDVFYGNAKDVHYGAGGLIDGAAGSAFLDTLLANRELEKIARFWTLGAGIDWTRMPRASRPRRISLPTYPFAKERCWIEQETPSPSGQQRTPAVRELVPVARIEEKQRMSFVPRWTRRDLDHAQDTEIGSLLLLDAPEELFTAMKDELGDGSVVLVQSGAAFQRIDGERIVIDRERDEPYRELIETLRSEGRLPGAIVHVASDACAFDVVEDVSRQLGRGVYALADLCQALLKETHNGPVRIVSVVSGDADAAPLDAAMVGFFKTLTGEEPKYWAKVVNVPASDRESIEEHARLLCAELRERAWAAQEIRYRSGAREARELAAASPVSNRAALPLRMNGIYLVTGGLGGLGLIFAEYLAKEFQAKLILVGRSAPDARHEETLHRLIAYGAEILCLQADVASLEDTQRIVREATARFGALHGVIHAAGVTRDAFLLRKTAAEINAVLAPKVHGTIHLDLATRGEDLDFFVLFSSIAGVMGNVGQADYAYANRFLDSFAEHRERLRAAQQRMGRTLSIAWPLWQDGGMRIAAGDLALLERQTGICPMPAAEGLRYFEEFLQSDAVQAIAVYGLPSRIAEYVGRQSRPAARSVVISQAIPQAIDATLLFAKTEEYLKVLIGEEIKLDPDRIDSSDSLESFGIDSVMINRINAVLERDLGALPKTLLYEHETVRALAKFLVHESRDSLNARFADAPPVISETHTLLAIDDDEQPTPVAAASDALETIAIVGVHGNYPHSPTMAAYWENLKAGRDLIDVVPRDRWDAEELYDSDPAAAGDGKIYCKWGGFLDDYDKFDPQFFKISAAEARLIDPQERLFLESVWTAIEDAGYTRESLKARFAKAGSADVGVFVGVTTNSYHLWAPEERARGNYLSPSAMPWSIANRVSYVFDFNGPSLPVDTACSSSLVAIHLACESLRNRDCQVAVAGGVNLYLHPAKYQSLCQKGMLSRDGKCRSYGAGGESDGDGFVPGEGVGTLVLKPLRTAVADGDRIYAVIRASAFDHSGRSNGYSAPNPNAQAALIRSTLAKAHVDPQTISYVEGHGTGTQLGDSIEVAALTQAFQQSVSQARAKTPFCPIGSVKANLGHAESAAGIAGVAKVLLQMEHRQLAPSIHSDDPNPNIEFNDSPFYLQHGLSDWTPSAAHPRRALVNSFGAGGVNACVLLEEYTAPLPDDSQYAGPFLFTLSAQNESRLRDYAGRLLDYLRAASDLDPARLCYTLQIGREAMNERLAIVAANLPELIERLSEWIERDAAADIHRGNAASRRGSRRQALTANDANLSELAAKWAAGERIDWQSLYSRTAPRRIGLPTYPFARERYWVSESPRPAPSEKPAPVLARLHPLLAYNSSTLTEVSFSSSLPESAFYAVDHQVHEERVFPGVGFLEMACMAGNIAGERRVRRIRDIVWIQPLSFRAGAQTLRTVLRPIGDSVEFEIASLDDENESIVHCEGRLAFAMHDADSEIERVPLASLKAQCERTEAGASYYAQFRQEGLYYGPSFQTIQTLSLHDSFALSKLSLAGAQRDEFDQFILHPSLLDGALQTAAGLVGARTPPTPYLPFALDELEIFRPLPKTCWAYAEFADAHHRNQAGVTKFNIRLLNENGDVLVRLTHLYVRPLPERSERSGAEVSSSMLR